MEIRWFLIALLIVGTVGCDRSNESYEYREGERSEEPEDPRRSPEKLDLVDSFEIGGFTYGIDSVERSDVHAQFEDAETGEMEWVTIHYRLVNTSDKAMAPIIPDVIVETDGLKFRDTGGNAQLGDAAAEEAGVSIGQLDKLEPGETELNMAIFKIPDAHVDEIHATFDFDGYKVPTDGPLEYQFTLQPKPGQQVLAQPEADAGDSDGSDDGEGDAGAE